ncbi:hypothetical protein M8818_007587 [Zalaria obscura]|uniref:Uncharacterized protein n=1 Tax=Zalaria obscura TaxID=2024903 RepID=A0ACC3S457_9PEZI
MDGNPMVLAVQGTMAAGDAPMQICGLDQREESVGIQPCVEIMTGAQFPLHDGNYAFDAVIPVEHTVSVPGPGKSSQYIQINRAAMRHQHRRFAGEDFVTGATLVTAGSKIEPQHVMAMASMGIRKVAVQRRIRVGVWSTGAELAAGSELNKIKDANGPFLLSALQGLGVDASFLGVLPDDEGKVAAAIKEELQTNEFDVLITSGAVSAGKFDHIRSAICSISAQVEFHGVAMRPGHPVLFATVPRLDLNCASDCDHAKCAASKVAFFGLPGNPIAAAACLRMIVTPYIRQLEGHQIEPWISARVVMQDDLDPNKTPNLPSPPPSHLDVFRHASLQLQGSELWVSISKEQSPSKIRPFTGSNCWVHIPRGHGSAKHGDMLRCFSLVLGQRIL